MKIYVVKRPIGSYEDYREDIEKIFTNKAKAEAYIENENVKLPLKQAEKCNHCLWKWEMCKKPTGEKPSCLDLDKFNTCFNYFKYADIQKLFYEEYEVEE